MKVSSASGQIVRSRSAEPRPRARTPRFGDESPAHATRMRTDPPESIAPVARSLQCYCRRGLARRLRLALDGSPSGGGGRMDADPVLLAALGATALCVTVVLVLLFRRDARWAVALWVL